jgi:predicted RNA-binding Zn-ribbon protein involved in translation (DUF1610 family)
MDALTADAAEDLLDGADLVTAMAGSIPEMKALRDRCLDAGIPAVIGCPGGGAKSCGPKTHLLIHEDSIAELQVLLSDEWRAQMAREGLAPVQIKIDESAEHLPCPACGTAAALVEGACSDCGLQLE